jgi:TonB-linked SusC/RagA family outer membrane protein
MNFFIPAKKPGFFKMFIIGFFLLSGTALSAQNKTFSGTVTDVADKTGIPNVAIVAKGSNARTISDSEGKFTLQVPEGVTVVFSSAEYEKAEVVTGSNSTLNITLRKSEKLLEEALVIGYGTSTKKEITGSVSTIKTKDFNSGVYTDALGMIQGKVAGLSITKPDGADPMAKYKIILRGTNTLTSGQGPLIIIDGVIGGDLNNINFNEVVSFDVLKDGAAAAIYGTRGTNGVVIITTKRAKAGRTVLEFNSQLSVQVAPQSVETLSADEFKYAIENYMPSRSGSLYGSKTDWFSEITRKNPLSQNYNLAISGGSDYFSHRTTFNYEKTDGLLKDNGVKKYLLKTNIKQAVFDNRLSLDYNLILRTSEYTPANYNLFYQAFIQNPTQAVYDPTNTKAGGYSQLQAIDYYNPVAMMNERQREGKTFVISPNVTGTLKIIKGLSWTNFLSYEAGMSKETSYKTKYYPQIIGRGGEAEINNSDNFNLQWESYGNYKISRGLHNLQAVAGYSYQKSGFSNNYLINSGFDSDIYGPNNIGAGGGLQAGTAEMGSYRAESKLIAFFARAIYNYDQKYLATISMRREGSSKFGNNNKWGNFPSVSLGWRMEKENFMKNVNWVNELKLRAGYGVTGNQDFGSYKSQILFGRAGRFYYNGEWINSYQPVSNPNPDLRWEKKQEMNIGIDYSLFNRKISGSVEVYSRTSTDLLYTYNVAVPPYLYPELFTNVGDISNQGIELSLNANILKKKDFSWDVLFTASKNVNKLKRISNAEFQETSYDVAWLGGNVPVFSQRLQEGKSLGTFYGPVWLGVDENGYDNFKNENPIGGVNADKWEEIGNANPFCTLGLSNYFSYKNWNLSFAIRSNIGGDVLNSYRLYYENWAAIGTKNIVRTQLENPQFIGATTYSSKYIEDATFVKLDNVSLAYRVPSKVKYFSSLVFSLTAQNVFTITGYKGLDPEVNLGGLEPGIEPLTYYPRTTAVTLGVSVVF